MPNGLLGVLFDKKKLEKAIETVKDQQDHIDDFITTEIQRSLTETQYSNQ